MLNKFSKTTLLLELIILILSGLTFFDFEFANLDPDEFFISGSIILSLLGLILSGIGVWKEYHKDIAISKRKTSIFILLSVPAVAAISVFTLFASFNF